MPTIRNVFACLVHENRECVIDLVRNLHFLDPASLILLYNGGRDSRLLNDSFPFQRYGAVIHPAPRPAVWGKLHQFALDCMEWALENHSFDTLTIVDSDQLATRPGYSEYLAGHLNRARHVGLLGNSTVVQTAGTRIGPAEAALREADLWKPLLQQFPSGEEKYPHWCFWPSTVFIADAARDLVRCFATNDQLRHIMEQTRIWATEELILPTLVALLGYDIGASPCSYDFVQYRVNYSPHYVESALQRQDVFWIHPVTRCYDGPVRKLVRERLNEYETPASDGQRLAVLPAAELLLTAPILNHMRRIEGWLEDAEADLLIAALVRAIATRPEAPAVVEVGSYCGRATVVLASVAAAVDSSGEVRIYALDPHDGILGSLDRPVRTSPSLEKFRRNISMAGLNGRVVSIVKRSSDVEWSRPVCFLLIDGLHDYASVARDFYRFESSLALGGYVAFHDYAAYWPGVQSFVDELIAGESFERIFCADSMIVLRKVAATKVATTTTVTTQPERLSNVAAPAVLTARPLVSCLMATANRRGFVPQAIKYFQRQDYPRKELLVLDDGEDQIVDVIPADPSIRYFRIQQRCSIGAKHNSGCELARGEIIVHWDDDDWMADWRLSYQVEELLPHPAHTLTGLSRLFFWDPHGDSAWEYVYPDGGRPWVGGGTFCYRKQFWDAHRHPDMNEGHDTVFVWGLHGANILPSANHGFYVALVHPRNTSSKRTNTSGWHSVPVDRIRQLVAADLGFYAAAI
jgi:hypothetical protein